jgi:hypothetical protein
MTWREKSSCLNNTHTLTKKERDYNAGLSQISRENRKHLRGRSKSSKILSQPIQNRNKRKYSTLKFMIIAGIMVVVGIGQYEVSSLRKMALENFSVNLI